jgi:hypothetical protein
LAISIAIFAGPFIAHLIITLHSFHTALIIHGAICFMYALLYLICHGGFTNLKESFSGSFTESSQKNKGEGEHVHHTSNFYDGRYDSSRNTMENDPENARLMSFEENK